MADLMPPAPDAQPLCLTETQRLRIRMSLLIVLKELDEPEPEALATALSHFVGPTVAAILAVQRRNIVTELEDAAIEVASTSDDRDAAWTASVLHRAAAIARVA